MAKRSIGVKMTLYGLLLLLMVMVIVVISNVSSSSFSKSYNKSADLYRELNDFYRNMQSARSSAQNYFYTLTESNLDDYRRHLAQAGGALNRMDDLVETPELRFRFGILRNMMESCDEHFLKMLAGGTSRPNYAGDYERLGYLFELTDLTQREYYGYLVQYTEEQQQILLSAWRANSVIVFSVLSVIILTAVLFSVLSTRWITRPINSIVKNIQKIKEGEYDLSKIKDAGPEFVVLGNAFDDMALSIHSNIRNIETNARLRQQLLEAENENLRVNELLTVSELKALQGQMNPHFLFNTLSMISQLASMENAPGAAELIEVTTRLLRYGLDKSSRNATLSEEIDCVQDYLYIQRMRFGDRVTFELHVEKDLPNLLLPGMLLQPLIENAVVHGVGGMTGDALVSVAVFAKDDGVRLTVEDNGQGIPSERLEWLMNDDLKEPQKELTSHIGLLNAKRRVEMLYGGQAQFNVDSVEGAGTLVSVVIAGESLPVVGEVNG